jgi:hypothetical protein
MFATVDGAVDQLLERRREARRRELLLLCSDEARIKQRVTEIVRAADDDGDLPSQTRTDASSPPTNHTHHPADL